MQFSHLCGWVPTCSNWQDFCLWSGRVTDWVVILIEILTGLRDLEFTDINWGSQGPTGRVCQLWFGSGVEDKIGSGRVLSCIEILIGYASSISLISYILQYVISYLNNIVNQACHWCADLSNSVQGARSWQPFGDCKKSYTPLGDCVFAKREKCRIFKFLQQKCHSRKINK